MRAIDIFTHWPIFTVTVKNPTSVKNAGLAAWAAMAQTVAMQDELVIREDAESV